MDRDTLEQLNLFDDFEKEIFKDADKKTCISCKKSLPFTFFSIKTALVNNKGVLSEKCRTCENKESREQANRVKVQVPPDENHVCYICNKTGKELLERANAKVVVYKDTYERVPNFRKKSIWVLDHDHKTGKARGWICDPCNVSLGNFQDNPEVCKRASKWLEER